MHNKHDDAIRTASCAALTETVYAIALAMPLVAAPGLRKGYRKSSVLGGRVSQNQSGGGVAMERRAHKGRGFNSVRFSSRTLLLPIRRNNHGLKECISFCIAFNKGWLMTAYQKTEKPVYHAACKDEYRP